MIISIEDGRLGNQLFQYSALKKLFPTEKLILVGYDALDHLVEPIDAKLIKKSQLPSWLPLVLLRKFILLLSNIRLLSSISEKKSQMSYWLETKKGVIFNINVLKSTFFQHTTIAEDLKLQFRIRECHSQKAISWISRNLPEKCQKKLVFIHIRRGDYLTWPDQNNPAVLDLDWYLKAMEYMGTRINNPLFIVLTDDIHYAKDVFSKYPNVVISENCQYVDLALMTQCRMGILSASSFAWWGAWFSIQNEKDNNIYIAPKYWGGHRTFHWFPEGFIFDWITYF